MCASTARRAEWHDRAWWKLERREWKMEKCEMGACVDPFSILHSPFSILHFRSLGSNFSHMLQFGSNGRRVAIIAGVRTPFAKAGTALKNLSAIDLGKLCVSELLQRTEIEGDQVE